MFASCFVMRRPTEVLKFFFPFSWSILHRWLKAVKNNCKSSISCVFDGGKSSSGLWRPLEPWFTIIYICDCRTQSRQSAKLFLESSEFGLYPNPSPAGECATPPRFGGVVESQFRRRDMHCVYIVLSECRSSSGWCDRMEGEQPDHVRPSGGISWSDGSRGRLALQLTIRRITWCW
jgi:hypothetical protein